MRQISPLELADWLADGGRTPPVLLDVREPWEYQICHLAGTKHIPMHAVPVRLNELAPDDEVVVICHHGGRSMQVAMFLERAGFSAVYNLMGGVAGWASQVDPGMPRY